jgi:hypothetical protein
MSAPTCVRRAERVGINVTWASRDLCTPSMVGLHEAQIEALPMRRLSLRHPPQVGLPIPSRKMFSAR